MQPRFIYPLPGRIAARIRSASSNRRAPILLGWSSDDEDALNSIIDDSFSRIYQSNWLDMLQPLTKDQVKAIVKAAMYYYALGYALTDVKAIYKQIQGSLPQIQPPINITRVLEFISGIDPETYPGDVALLKSGHFDAVTASAQKIIATQKKISDLSYEVTDKLKRGGSSMIQSAVDAEKAISDALPWYLKPKVILPVVIGGIGIFYLMQAKGALKMLPKFGYKKNPVSKTEKRENARRLYKTWNARNPKKTTAIDEIDASELVLLGDGLELCYRSNKWTGKKENYQHEFGKGVKLMATPDGKTLILHGGKMSVEDVGIVN